MAASTKFSLLQLALGEDLFSKVQRARVLMVGAGGIGCELLKNLVLSGFEGHIEVVDLDTIDLSNLNRQFLFQAQHISKSKAHVARESALRFNPNANIVSHHVSIMDSKFSTEFFRTFDLVLNALDNLAARRHVNRLCLAANVPLIESGTAGYLGQVTVIKKGESECFECHPKATPKTFPVCTIRSTPSAPIHCVVWAKDYLFAQLFGKLDDEEDETPIDADSENAAELAALRKEANALKELRRQLGQPGTEAKIFQKVFGDDIKRLASMSDMWKNRSPPQPLDYATLFESNKAANSKGQTINTSGLADQQLWSLGQNFHTFLRSLTTLAGRLKSEQGSQFSFDKDDNDMLDFVTSTANLRAYVYKIDLQTRFTIKSMAGNIIPAIATTNAVIAGLIVMEAFHLLANAIDKCSTTYLAHGGRRSQLLMRERLAPPNKNCYVCQNKTMNLAINTNVASLRLLVQTILQKQLAMIEPAISELTGAGGARLLYDVEFEDNLDSTLNQLKVIDGTMLSISDDTQDYRLVVNIHHQEVFANSEILFAIEGDVQPAAPLPQPPVTATPAQDTEAGPSTLKRKAQDDDLLDDELDMVIVSPEEYDRSLKRARKDN